MKRYFSEAIYDTPKENEPETSHIVYKASDVARRDVEIVKFLKAARPLITSTKLRAEAQRLLAELEP